MQAVPDRDLGKIAEMRVKGGQRRRDRRIAADPAFRRKPASLRPFQDLVGDERRTAWVEHLRLRQLLDQLLHGRRFAMQAGIGHRRRQVPDHDGGGAPLGLSRFAGIVDDERIDERERADGDLRPAGAGQGDCLAGQPLRGAVRAEMDEGVDLLDLAQAEIEGKIAVGRRNGEIVIRWPCGRRALAPAGGRRRHFRPDRALKRNAPSVTAGSPSGVPEASIKAVRSSSGNVSSQSRYCCKRHRQHVGSPPVSLRIRAAPSKSRGAA